MTTALASSEDGRGATAVAAGTIKPDANTL
jgi:hypothetical protein